MAESLQQLAQHIAQTVERKRESYTPNGDVIDTVYSVQDFLKLLYPQGIPPDQYARAVLLARLFDKLVRVVNYGIKDGFDENPAVDIVGYGLRLHQILEYTRKEV